MTPATSRPWSQAAEYARAHRTTKPTRHAVPDAPVYLRAVCRRACMRDVVALVTAAATRAGSLRDLFPLASNAADAIQARLFGTTTPTYASMPASRWRPVQQRPLAGMSVTTRLLPWEVNNAASTPPSRAATTCTASTTPPVARRCTTARCVRRDSNRPPACGSHALPRAQDMKAAGSRRRRSNPPTCPATLACSCHACRPPVRLRAFAENQDFISRARPTTQPAFLSHRRYDPFTRSFMSLYCQAAVPRPNPKPPSLTTSPPSPQRPRRHPRDAAGVVERACAWCAPACPPCLVASCTHTTHTTTLTPGRSHSTDGPRQYGVAECLPRLKPTPCVAARDSADPSPLRAVGPARAMVYAAPWAKRRLCLQARASRTPPKSLFTLAQLSASSALFRSAPPGRVGTRSRTRRCVCV